MTDYSSVVPIAKLISINDFDASIYFLPLGFVDIQIRSNRFTFAFLGGGMGLCAAI